MTKAKTRESPNRSRLERFSRPASPALRFTPYAWAKLLFLRDYSTTEVGGFGISSPNDLLLVQDVQLVKQVCSWASVKFDDDSVADFFDEQVDMGGKPEQFARLWIHTHPGDCPNPSGTDEETFARVFGSSDWAVMAILAKGSQTYARLRFNAGPGGEIEIPMGVDYSVEFEGCDFAAWEQAYLANVRSEMQTQPFGSVDGRPFCASSKDVKGLRDGEKSEVPVLVPSPSEGDSSPPSDPDLARLLARWPRLPDAIKAAISALVQASGADDSSTSTT